jgi:hypothetical protein
MIDTLKPGQTVRCTLVKLPRSRGNAKTLRTLMLLDPQNVKSLRRAQVSRRRTTVVYNRGNRDWVQRRPCARIVSLRPGANWSLVFNHDLAAELRSVEPLVRIEAA